MRLSNEVIKRLCKTYFCLFSSVPQHSPVVPGTDGALILKLVVQAALVEGVLAEEVDGGEGEATLAQTALHYLEDLGTGSGEVRVCEHVCVCVCTRDSRKLIFKSKRQTYISCEIS